MDVLRAERAQYIPRRVRRVSEVHRRNEMRALRSWKMGMAAGSARFEWQERWSATGTAVRQGRVSLKHSRFLAALRYRLEMRVAEADSPDS